jgi:hypothetical protein
MAFAAAISSEPARDTMAQAAAGLVDVIRGETIAATALRQVRQRAEQPEDYLALPDTEWLKLPASDRLVPACAPARTGAHRTDAAFGIEPPKAFVVEATTAL